MRMRHLFTSLVLAAAACAAGAQTAGPATAPAREPASPALLGFFYKEIREWDQGIAPQGVGVMSSRPVADALFHARVRQQLAHLGTAAFPIAPQVAELLHGTTKNHYSLSYILLGMVPTAAESEIPALLQTLTTGGGPRLLAMAQLGRSPSQQSLAALQGQAAAEDLAGRVLAYAAMGYVGQHFPEAGAQAVAAGLKDASKEVRQVSVNALRLIGPRGQVAPQLIEYLRTGDNRFMAVAALKAYPIEAVSPARADLEAIVSDPKLSTFQKQDAVDLLVRLQQPAAPAQAAGQVKPI